MVCVFSTAGPTIKLIAWGEGIVEDMCYERRRAEACVDQSAHRTLVNVGVVSRLGIEPIGVCLLLQYLIQSCSRGGGTRVQCIILPVYIVDSLPSAPQRTPVQQQRFKTSAK